MKKDQTITLRVTQSDKAAFQHLATEANLTISEFIIQSAKQAPPSPKHTQAQIARQLCVHTNLVTALELSESDRQELRKWEKETWQTLK